MARFELMGMEEALQAGQLSSADAFFELGMLYSSGREAEPDLVAAHKWFNLAAMKGNARAKAYRMEIACEMSRAEIVQAQRLAREWLTKH